MPRYTQQQKTSLDLDPVAAVAWLVLATGVLGAGSWTYLGGWPALPLAGSALLGSLVTWAVLRVLLDIRDAVQE